MGIGFEIKITWKGLLKLLKYKFKMLIRFNLYCFFSIHDWKNYKECEQKCKRCKRYRINDVRFKSDSYKKSLVDKRDRKNKKEAVI